MTQLYWIAFWTEAATFRYCLFYIRVLYLTSATREAPKTSSASVKKIHLPFPASWTSSVLQLFLPLVSLCETHSGLSTAVKKKLCGMHTSSFCSHRSINFCLKPSALTAEGYTLFPVWTMLFLLFVHISSAPNTFLCSWPQPLLSLQISCLSLLLGRHHVYITSPLSRLDAYVSIESCATSITVDISVF